MGHYCISFSWQLTSCFKLVKQNASVTLNLSRLVYGLLIYIEKLANNGFDLDMWALKILVQNVRNNMLLPLYPRSRGWHKSQPCCHIQSLQQHDNRTCLCTRIRQEQLGLEYLPTTLVREKLCSLDTDTSIGYDTYRIRGYTIFEKAMTRDTTGIL